MTTTPQIEETTPTDGRTARSVRTHEAIVEATLDLVNSGNNRPTSVQVAERAGVSVRSVFQHFDDLEGLFTSVGTRGFERVTALRRPIDPAASLLERVEAYVAQRCQMNEAVSPMMQAALVHVQDSAAISRQFQDGHDIQRVWIAEVFAPEVNRVGDRAEVLIDNLLIPTAWVTWSLLRRLENRSVEQATEVVHTSMKLVLAGAGLLPSGPIVPSSPE